MQTVTVTVTAPAPEPAPAHDVVVAVPKMPANLLTLQRLHITANAAAIAMNAFGVRTKVVIAKDGRLEMSFTTDMTYVDSAVLGGALQALLAHVANGALDVYPQSATGDVAFLIGSGVCAFPSSFYAAVQTTLVDTLLASKRKVNLRQTDSL